MTVGLVLYFGHREIGGDGVVSGFVLVLLYLKGPIEELAGALPLLSEAQVSFSRIAQLSADLAQREDHFDLAARPAGAPEFETIELRGATYAFPPEPGRKPFVLGPLDLTIRRGETLFITGENGCGKTTLIKLLLGLYDPTSGTLLRDGRPVDASRRDDYRQLFSAVFFDYHLFDDIVIDDPRKLRRADDYLARLQLDGVVTIEDGVFSTTDLSAGQRKRLALIQVYLEGRPVLVFDEWAAEQDPTFRRIFYSELLPDLKLQGKTLIVISHDDRYFAVADRRIRMERGRIVEQISAETGA